jgi:hypothetical protein
MSSLPERNRGACKRSARGVVRADRLRYGDHIALGAGDYGESLAFYTGKLGITAPRTAPSIPGIGYTVPSA